jgi:hypothetical protein
MSSPLPYLETVTAEQKLNETLYFANELVDELTFHFVVGPQKTRHRLFKELARIGINAAIVDRALQFGTEPTRLIGVEPISVVAVPIAARGGEGWRNVPRVIGETSPPIILHGKLIPATHDFKAHLLSPFVQRMMLQG